MPLSKRTVAVFTGNRAEYGLLYPVLEAIRADARLQCQLIVSGGHLDPGSGMTRSEIERDGFTPAAEIPLPSHDGSSASTLRATATVMLGLEPVLSQLRPDFLLVYGDRYEAFGAVAAGAQLAVPVVHMEGGDLTEGGALDDSLRHAMTKLAHLHLTTNPQATERVLRLGEEPWRVHTVGFPPIDLIRQGRFASESELKTRLGLDLNRPAIVFTQHSVTAQADQAETQIRPSLQALEILAQEGCQVIITYPNNDAGGQRMRQLIEQLANKKVPNLQVVPSLGRHLYHGVLNFCGRTGKGVCAGNSSSGIKETPAFGCPCVNIGERQQGRLRADNLLEVGYQAKEIERALRTALFDTSFRDHCAGVPNPYGTGQTGAKVAELLATTILGEALIKKRMTY